MDARVEPLRILGFDVGDAHVIRNAGGIATEDALRSLVVSQWLLGTEEIVLLHHTDCGMEGLDEVAVEATVREAAGTPLPFALGAFDDVASNVRTTAERLRASPFLRHTKVRGYVFDVANGHLDEIDLD